MPHSCGFLINLSHVSKYGSKLFFKSSKKFFVWIANIGESVSEYKELIRFMDTSPFSISPSDVSP
ncbi:hypothetical protein QTP88_017601 [Uroleucon formosanum]